MSWALSAPDSKEDSGGLVLELQAIEQRNRWQILLVPLATELAGWAISAHTSSGQLPCVWKRRVVGVRYRAWCICRPLSLSPIAVEELHRPDLFIWNQWLGSHQLNLPYFVPTDLLGMEGHPKPCRWTGGSVVHTPGEPELVRRVHVILGRD